MHTVRLGVRIVLISTVAGCGGGTNATATVTFESGESKPASAESSAPDAVTSSEFGTLKGRVLFEGVVPNLPPLITRAAEIRDKEICAAQDVPDEKLILGADYGVANVFIYLPKAPTGAAVPPAPAEPVIFDQRACRFLPHVLLVRAGQTVKVLSDDPIVHNTRTYPRRNTGVSELTVAGDRVGKKTLIYRRPELAPIKVGCDYHSFMRAWHLPLDHPWAAVSGPDGNFAIKAVPAGKHDFRVWHEAAAGGYIARRQSVTIRDGETTELIIRFPSSCLQR